MRPTGGRRDGLPRLAALAGGLCLGFLGWGALALGTCHDSGGFCSGTFSATHVVFYLVAVALLSAAAALLTRSVTRRPRVIGGVAGAAALLVLGIVLVVETTG